MPTFKIIRLVGEGKTRKIRTILTGEAGGPKAHLRARDFGFAAKKGYHLIWI
jgi:hypothetical protein